MDSLRKVLVILLLCIARRVECSRTFDLAPSSGDTFDVVASGAVGDGRTDDSKAFLQAWTSVCAATTTSPTLLIPSGKTFLLNPLSFSGPCKASKVNVQVLGNLVAPKLASWKELNAESWIEFTEVDGLTISGSGQIDAKGSDWWTSCPDLEGCNRPAALNFDGCNGLELSGLTHINSAKNHISVENSNKVIISSLKIIAPETSPNTDGIEISQATNVIIKDSSIQTGDDCVAIKGGSSFINITNVQCGPGHGISVGSLGADRDHETVEEIHVRGCNLTKTTISGLRIKTWQGGSGYARKISFDQITMQEVTYPILIDQFYCNGKRDTCNNHTSAVQISDVTFSNIHGTSATEEAIKLSCSPSVPCKNIVVKDVGITSTTGSTRSTCNHVNGSSSQTSPPVPCLS